MPQLDPALWQAAQPLLDEVLDRPEAERGDILARARADRPELARLVEELLAAEEDELPTLEGIGLGDVLRDRPTTLGGHAVGPYTLERLLGEGGMGAVWLGRRSDGVFEGAAAIKLLHLGALGPGRAERFQREATLLARLDHPNIARLLDAGVTPAGQPYLVLEHVDGIRLDRYCAERRLPLDARLRLVLQVCAAVSAAHGALVVHRDIKPANVLVTADGRVKLLDFGIARLVEDGAAGAPAQTTQALTPEFAAPEQVREIPVTTAADVYALGLLLHVLLTGRHPTGYDSRTPADFLRTTLERDPMRPSEAVLPGPGWSEAEAGRHAAALGLSPRGLRRLLRGDLDVIVARTLRKEPAERYAGVAELAADLERHLGHQPVRARPESAAYLVRKYVRRHRVLVGAAGLVLATLLGATWMTTGQMLEARHQRDAARLERDRAVYESRRAVASSGFMQTILSAIPPGDSGLTVVGLLERARALLLRRDRDDPRFAALMALELAEQYRLQGLILEARDLIARATELALASGDPDVAAQAGCRLALALGRSDSARRTLAAAIERRRLLSDPTVRTRLYCTLAQGSVAHPRGSDSAILGAWEAVRIAETHGDTISLAMDLALASLASHLYRGKDAPFRRALEVTRRRIAIQEGIGLERSLPLLSATLGAAAMLELLGELRAADSTIARVEALTSGVHPYASENPLSQRDALQARLGRYAPALRAYDVRLAEGRRDGSVPLQQRALTGSIVVLSDSGAIVEARHQLARLRALGDGDSLRLRWAEGALAEAEGAPDRAHRLYLDAIRRAGFPDLKAPEFTQRIVHRAARAALADGDLAAADSLARHALRIALGVGQVEGRSADLGLGRLLLARIALARTDTAAARAAAQLAWRGLANGLGPDHPSTREAGALHRALDLPPERSRPISGGGP